MGIIQTGDISARNLSDHGTKYLVAGAVLKFQIQGYFENEYPDARLWAPHIKEKMQEVLADHKSVRSLLTPLPRSDRITQSPLDLSWHRRLPESANNALDIFESIIYGTKYENCIRNIAKSEKGYDILLQSEFIVEDLVSVVAKIQEEHASPAPKNLIGSIPGAAISGKTKDEDMMPAYPMLTELDDGKRESWLKHAARIYRSHITLICPGATESAVKESIANSETGRLLGDASGLMILHCDVKLTGETISAPHERLPPIRSEA